MSLLRQARSCVRSRPLTAVRTVSTTSALIPARSCIPLLSRSHTSDRLDRKDRVGIFARRALSDASALPRPPRNANPSNTGENSQQRQRQRQPGTSRKHTPSGNFDFPTPRNPSIGPDERVVKGGSRKKPRGGAGYAAGRESFGNRSTFAEGSNSRGGDGGGFGSGSGFPRSTRHVREGDEGRRGQGFGLGKRNQNQGQDERGDGLIMRRRPNALSGQPGLGQSGQSASSQGNTRSSVAGDEGVVGGQDAEVADELYAEDVSSGISFSRGSRGREDDRERHGFRLRGRGGPTDAVDGRGGRSSRSFLDQLDDDADFVISRNSRARGGRGGVGADGSGRSHKANARAAQQAILYGTADKGSGRAVQGKQGTREGKSGDGVKARQEVKEEKKVFIPSSVSVGRLADIFGVKIFNLQNAMRKLGLGEEQRRADYLLTSEQACDLAIEYELDPIVDDEAAFDIYPEPESNSSSTHPLRPPVVTIMGHVDHGKTTLLDSLRRTSVAAGEAGGITQHIGAFSVALADILPAGQVTPESSQEAGGESPGSITFLDTPGHAAFTAMRARGASATDLVVLVVAADDGVMPQTKEVIELVRRDGDKVGLVVAINKCDKTGVDFDKVKSALGAEGVLLEEDGGDTPSVRVSGLTGLGLDQLVETLSTLAEMRELRARKDGSAEGIVLESRVDRGRGNVATVLVQKGTLTSGACIVAGTTWAKVRQMQDSSGRPIKSAGPGTPVSLTGWKDLPTAGDVLLQASSEDDAKRAITNRLRDIERRKLLADVEQINEKRALQRIRAEKDEAALAKMKQEGRSDAEMAAFMREIERRDAKGESGVLSAVADGQVEGNGQEDGEQGKKWLNLVIKADVSGTVEAVVGSLEGIGNKEAGVKVVGTGVGEVGESDVNMAEATGATIIAFSVPVSKPIEALATQSNVPLRASKIIYELIERVRSDVAALLPPAKEIRVTGEATVQQIFDIKLKGKETLRIAGSRVSNGVVEMKEGVRARVLRGKDREVIHEGVISTLKHLKKDVTEVRKGTECGIGLEGFSDIREGDEVITFTTVDVPRTL